MGCSNTSIGGSLHQLILGAEKVVLKLLILDLKLLKLLCLAGEQAFQKYIMITQGVPIFIMELILDVIKVETNGESMWMKCGIIL